MYTIEINLPNLAKGAEVAIDGLGVFENGHTYYVSAEDAEIFRLRNTTHPSGEHDPADGFMTYETKQGPTLLQAFKGHPYITVMTEKAEDKLKREAKEKADAEAAATKSDTNSVPVVVDDAPVVTDPPVVDTSKSTNEKGGDK